ncbi:MRC1-like domain-containing protein [Thamnocephalis sphaerospora]|uniref:MRC1-like domain-containing protein n=1 Tax=Thamnocephalis sphaerospora TaxID=78915 RepID=A0A4P9XUI4_9FUNG|nr:MRC1-like domain-containing protein [Thamnocephalis sphaerospora]|eukprot:RKP09888.1 MRC1-like domain-containing protein [Thamnocephalis sphaerospora]
MDTSRFLPQQAELDSDHGEQRESASLRAPSPELEFGGNNAQAVASNTPNVGNSEVDASQITGNEWMDLYRCSDSEDDVAAAQRPGIDPVSGMPNVDSDDDNATPARSHGHQRPAWLIDSDVSDFDDDMALVESDDDSDREAGRSAGETAVQKGKGSMRAQLKKAAQKSKGGDKPKQARKPRKKKSKANVEEDQTAAPQPDLLSHAPSVFDDGDAESEDGVASAILEEHTAALKLLNCVDGQGLTKKEELEMHRERQRLVRQTQMRLDACVESLSMRDFLKSIQEPDTSSIASTVAIFAKHDEQSTDNMDVDENADVTATSSRVSGKQPDMTDSRPPSFSAVRIADDGDSDLELEILDTRTTFPKVPTTPVKLRKKIQEVHDMRERELEQRRQQIITPKELNAMLQRKISEQIAERRRDEEAKARQLGVWQAPTNGVSVLARERERRKAAKEFSQHQPQKQDGSIASSDDELYLYSGEEEEAMSDEDEDEQINENTSDAELDETERRMRRLLDDDDDDNDDECGDAHDAEPAKDGEDGDGKKHEATLLALNHRIGDLTNAAAMSADSQDAEDTEVEQKQVGASMLDNADDYDSPATLHRRAGVRRRTVMLAGSDEEDNGDASSKGVDESTADATSAAATDAFAGSLSTLEEGQGDPKDSPLLQTPATKSAKEDSDNRTETRLGARRLIRRTDLTKSQPKPKRPIDKRTAGFLDAEAEEEEDEWAGFLGQDQSTRQDDDDDRDDRHLADLDMVVQDISEDEQENDEEVAALHRQQMDDKDAADVSNLLRDITEGNLRRRGRDLEWKGYGLDLDDDEMDGTMYARAQNPYGVGRGHGATYDETLDNLAKDPQTAAFAEFVRGSGKSEASGDMSFLEEDEGNLDEGPAGPLEAARTQTSRASVQHRSRPPPRILQTSDDLPLLSDPLSDDDNDFGVLELLNKKRQATSSRPSSTNTGEALHHTSMLSGRNTSKSSFLGHSPSKRRRFLDVLEQDGGGSGSRGSGHFAVRRGVNAKPATFKSAAASSGGQSKSGSAAQFVRVQKTSSRSEETDGQRDGNARSSGDAQARSNRLLNLLSKAS